MSPLQLFELYITPSIYYHLSEMQQFVWEGSCLFKIFCDGNCIEKAIKDGLRSNADWRVPCMPPYFSPLHIHIRRTFQYSDFLLLSKVSGFEISYQMRKGNNYAPCTRFRNWSIYTRSNRSCPNSFPGCRLIGSSPKQVSKFRAMLRSASI
jgi:hypothetical protein